MKHLIQELGWTEEQAAEIRHRLASFEEDWMLLGWRSTMIYKRGDVILVNFPNSELKTYKKRSGLIFNAGYRAFMLDS